MKLWKAATEFTVLSFPPPDLPLLSPPLSPFQPTLPSNISLRYLYEVATNYGIDMSTLGMSPTVQNCTRTDF